MSVWRLPGPVRVDGEQVRDGAWVVGDRITFERPAAAPDGTIDGFVLPGLVDAHCHVGLIPSGAADHDTTRVHATAERDAGVLLIRDAGSPADTRWIDDEPDLPTIIRAGRHIGRTRRYLRGVSAEVEPAGLVAEVLRQAARGDGWVKLVGDWIDRDLGDLAPCWPAAELKQAIDAAHGAGARVTAHCFGPDCLPDLIAAGIDCIEHGSGFAPETIEAARAAGIAVVPTLIQLATFTDLADQGEAKFPVWAARMRDLHRRRHRTIGDLVDAGVPVFAGSDAGTVHPHGLIAAEVTELARLMPPLAAVGAASWDARAWLGRPGLVEGARADLAVFAADPTVDPAVLGHPSAIVLGGRLFG